MTTTVDYPLDQDLDSSKNLARTPNLSELVSGILNDVQHLLKQQVDLIKSEFKADLRKTKQAAQCFGVGTILLSIGAVLLSIAGVYALEAFAHLPLWACWLIVGGGLTVLGVVAMAVGKSILNSYNPLPDKSLNALQENVSCLTNPPK